MKFKFNKKEAVKIIQSTKNFNTDHVDQQDLTEAAVLSVKQMRKNMLNNGGDKIKAIIQEYLPNENISIKEIRSLEERINKKVKKYELTRNANQLEEIFHLIHLWGGNTGRNIYVMGGGFNKNIKISSYKKLIDTAIDFSGIDELVNQISIFKTKSSNICTPFITKHTRFFSQRNKLLPFLPIYDSLLSEGLMQKWSNKYKKYKKLNIPNSPAKKSGQDELSFYWMNMVELSNELKMSLNKLERILFNHFRNVKNQS